MMPVLSWVCVVLLTGLEGAHGLASFPKNVVVAAEHPVTLTCDSATPGTVTWMFKRNGEEEVRLDHGYRQDGRSLIVTYEGHPQLGEYSCWSGMNKLWSAHLVLRDEDESASNSISCSAKSYNCVFSCLWTNTDYTAVRMGLGKECAEDSKNCLWIASLRPNPENGRKFELPHSLTPYMEETTMIEVTAEAMTDEFVFQRTTKKFHLRDIIKPKSPRIVSCQEVGLGQLNVAIEPASSWSVPHSFFKLEHNIEYVSKDNGETSRSSSHLIPRNIEKFRARSRDPLVLSAWSEWTPWRNVKPPGTPKRICRKKKSKKTGPKRRYKNPLNPSINFVPIPTSYLFAI